MKSELDSQRLRDSLGFEQVHKLVHDLQQIAQDSGHEQRLLIGIDQENGTSFLLIYALHTILKHRIQGSYQGLAFPLVKRGLSCMSGLWNKEYHQGTHTHYVCSPGAMTVAATGSTELAEEIARASGSEMRLAGINWVYSPVADVNTDPRNPVIGPRSFGDGNTSKYLHPSNDPANACL